MLLLFWVGVGLSVGKAKFDSHCEGFIVGMLDGVCVGSDVRIVWGVWDGMFVGVWAVFCTLKYYEM